MTDGLDWWCRALAGEAPQITSEPMAGFYKRKLVRGGTWVAARIWIAGAKDELNRPIEDQTMHCEVDGQPRDPVDEWLWLAANPIDETEFKLLSRLGPWARQHAPNDPNADPTKAIDFMKAPIPAFRKQRRKLA